MTAMDLITALRVELFALQNKGQTTVSLAGLDEYLVAQQAKEAGDAGAAESLDKAKHDLEVWKVELQSRFARNHSLMESVFKTSETAFNAATLINGGAVVALLAFLGNLSAKSGPLLVGLSVPDLRRAMLAFTLGVACSGFGHVARYFTQFFGFKDRSSWAGWSNLMVILLMAGSFAAFAYGGVQALRAVH
jgi:hypothetical protein